MSRLFHLLVALLLVGAYYAGLPDHLWDEQGFKPSFTGTTPHTPAWRVRDLGASPAGGGEPHLMAHDAGVSGLWRAPEGWRLFHSGEQNTPLYPARPVPEKAFLTDMRDGQPVVVARYREGVGAPWYRLHGDERRRLHLSSLPLPRWHAGAPVGVREGVALPLYEPRVGGRLAVLHLGHDGRIRGLAPAGRSTGAGSPALLVDNPAEALLVEAGEPRSWSADGGRAWRPAELEWEVPPGKARIPVRRGPGWWWWLSVEHAGDRETVRVHESRDHGTHWQPLPEADWEVGAVGDCEASAPAAAHSRDGRLHLLHRGSDCRVRHAVLAAGEAS